MILCNIRDHVCTFPSSTYKSIVHARIMLFFGHNWKLNCVPCTHNIMLLTMVNEICVLLFKFTPWSYIIIFLCKILALKSKKGITTLELSIFVAFLYWVGGPNMIFSHSLGQISFIHHIMDSVKLIAIAPLWKAI